MEERKVLFFILSLIFYCLYSVNMWFLTKNENQNIVLTPKLKISGYNPLGKPIPLMFKDACSVVDVFTKKPPVNKARKLKIQDMDTDNNTITVIGITVFLVILLLNAFLDILKVKEEERARRKLNPDGERRKSLAEFANKKILRRESSKFGAQLFQISESVATTQEENKSRKETRPYTRGESINSFLSEKTQKTQESSAPASIGDTSDPKLVKRQSVAKLIDNKLQWISQRPVYNYYQCELRFWRNETLRTIPYALWYHMFRGQQTRSLNIRSLQIPKCTTEPKGRCLVRVNEEYLDIIFPPNNTVIVNFAPAPPSLLELSRRKLYQTISDTTKRLTSATYSIYSDYTIEDDFSNVDINGNTTEYKDGCHNRNLNREKQYTVPNDVVKKYFDYLPSFIKKYLCNGPISRCENVNCKAPVFDYAYYEFCLEKIILIDSSSDVILSATFCSKSCADSWNVGKHVLPWKLSF
ncbi:uncharacterized protein LOC121733016 isoform X2 [Aricia agestis]|uniref:uncharacterized protein LOC121733016 isoform X2 n=1 Tax=Aricia agestis TaxID=91739 RepID=UPI001C204983|nr:uncharacterized protein LOC121733016 isoform X2 [Aricia agestis]